MQVGLYLFHKEKLKTLRLTLLQMYITPRKHLMLKYKFDPKHKYQKLLL